MTEQQAFLAPYLFLGLLLIITAIPLIKRKIGRNKLYGFRVKKTLQSDDIWYNANEYMARRLLVCGVIVMAVTLALFFFAGRVPVPTLACAELAATFIPLCIALAQSMMYLKKW